MRERIAVAFGRVLKTAREAAGLSQEALAVSARVDRTYPSLLERGLRSPTLGTLVALAPLLGIAPEALVRRTQVQLRRLPKVTKRKRASQRKRSRSKRR
jgi:transcriptional regulator with XRE-family HTH domain